LHIGFAPKWVNLATVWVLGIMSNFSWHKIQFIFLHASRESRNVLLLIVWFLILALCFSFTNFWNVSIFTVMVRYSFLGNTFKLYGIADKLFGWYLTENISPDPSFFTLEKNYTTFLMTLNYLFMVKHAIIPYFSTNPTNLYQISSPLTHLTFFYCCNVLFSNLHSMDQTMM
jgi:hypothetical protein